MLNNIVINSDDFGYSLEVNNAIIKGFDLNYINSCTMLVNFEDGFNDALEKIKLNPEKLKKVGLHFNLTEGIPLTKKIKTDDFFCENGHFHSRLRSRPIFYLNKKRRQLVEMELIAQIEKALLHGINITHIDSHHHVHTEFAILRIVLKVAAKYDISKVRISRNIGEIVFMKKCYKFFINSFMKFKGMNSSDYFGDTADFRFNISNYRKDKKYEIMVHCLPSNTEDVIDLDGLPLRKIDEYFSF
jgi:predicted glycoside hydrolase/deacetylase ChbG (UPF0249 family)